MFKLDSILTSFFSGLIIFQNYPQFIFEEILEARPTTAESTVTTTTTTTTTQTTTTQTTTTLKEF